jgi:hypothetical protein
MRIEEEGLHEIATLTAIAAVGISVLVAGGLVAAQDRFTLQSPNGIAFAEFKGYEAWQMISPSDPDRGRMRYIPGSRLHQSDSRNPAMIKAYSEGIRANGKTVPDGAVMAKLEWAKKRTAGRLTRPRCRATRARFHS